MAEIANFTQPDTAPSYFIDFLDSPDNQAEVKNFRAETAKRLNLSPGDKVLDLGCGIGGATFPLSDLTGPTGLAAGVDISAALIEAPPVAAPTAQDSNSASAMPAPFLTAMDFSTSRARNESSFTCPTASPAFTK